jgi:hypothetical protein
MQLSKGKRYLLLSPRWAIAIGTLISFGMSVYFSLENSWILTLPWGLLTLLLLYLDSVLVYAHGITNILENLPAILKKLANKLPGDTE